MKNATSARQPSWKDRQKIVQKFLSMTTAAQYNIRHIVDDVCSFFVFYKIQHSTKRRGRKKVVCQFCQPTETSLSNHLKMQNWHAPGANVVKLSNFVISRDFLALEHSNQMSQKDFHQNVKNDRRQLKTFYIILKEDSTLSLFFF